MRPTDQDVRDQIINSGIQSIVVTASAGCGKTTILVDKMLKTIQEIKNHQTVAAITFTIKATQELMERTAPFKMDKDLTICTNDSFVENEIIRPFLIDVFGEKFKQDFIVDYNMKFKTDKEGMKVLVEKNILGTYRNDRRNFKFQLALYILQKSLAAQQYLIAKYRMIFIDEYQDSDQDMHNLFMYIKNNLEIPLFIVGDPKQAIYLWRGAKENIFNEFDDSFEKFELFHNFRSHMNITNFANLIHSENYKENMCTESIEEVEIVFTDQGFNEAVLDYLDSREINLNDEITIIINVNSPAEDCKNFLNSNGYDFEYIPRTPIDEGIVNSFVLRCIIKMVLDRFYSMYNLLIDLNLELTIEQKKELENLILKLKYTEAIIENIKPILDKISEIINIELSEREVTKFCETLSNEKYHVSFINSDKKHKVMTVFATKGLEFDQVIIRASDYSLDDTNNLNNHYVAITRAKNKVVVIDNTHNYREKLTKRLNEKGIAKLEEVATVNTI